MKRVWRCLFTLVIIFILFLILKDINFYEVYLILAEAKLSWVFFAFLSTFATFIVWNIRIVHMLRQYVPLEFLFSLKVLFAGSFFNTITPGGGIGGEPFRANYISKKYKKPISKVLGYTLGDTFFRIMVLSFFVIFSVFFVLIYVKINSNLRLILEIGLILLFLIFLGIIYFTLRKSNFNIGEIFRKLHKFRFIRDNFPTEDGFVVYINRKFNNFRGIFKQVILEKENWFVGIFLSVVFWGLNFLTAYFLFLAFYSPVNFFSVIIVFTLGNIVGSFSPIPGGIAITEGSMVFLYSAMGIIFPLALLVAFLQRLMYYFFSLLIGGYCLISLKRKNGLNGNGFF